MGSSSHPFAAPTVSGNTISVDTYLKQPTRITKMLEDLTLQRFVSEYIFSKGPKPSGGAVIYDEITANDLYLDDDVQRIEPSGQFPRLDGSRLAPKVAKVSKYGGEVEIAWEARDRNDQRAFSRDITRLSNTIVRKINTQAIAALDAALAIHTAQATTMGALGLDGWATGAAATGVVTGMGTAFAQIDRPDALFSAVQLLADVQELGIEYNCLLVNPTQTAQMSRIYGGAKNLRDVLGEAGMALVKSNRVTAGTGYFVAQGQVGGMGLEQPLATRVYTEDRHQRDVVQSSVIPLFYIDNPTAIVKVTGLGA